VSLLNVVKDNKKGARDIEVVENRVKTKNGSMKHKETGKVSPGMRHPGPGGVGYPKGGGGGPG